MHPFPLDDVDSMLSELIELEEEVKIAHKRIDEIRTWCKTQGSFCTNQYVCTVMPRSRTGIAALDKVVAAIGMDILEQNQLINVTFFQIINVAKRGAISC